MPINDTTTNQGYPKPNIANTLADDVGRLRTALDEIDADMTARVVNGSAITVPTGTATGASVSFTGAPGTGLYSPGANQLALTTNGTPRLHIGSTGYIGIGSAPNGVANILVHDSESSILQFTNDITGNTDLDGSIIGQVGNDFYIYNGEAGSLTFGTNSTERLRIDATGQIEAVSLGTAAAPTFSFTGDPNTGIYSPGADQLALTTGGTGRLFVDASGNVGVGVSSPQHPVHVDGTSGSVQFRAGVTYAGTGLDIKATENSDVTIDVNDSTKTVARALVFSQAGAERLRITSAGLVGIGTSSPTTSTQIEVVKNSSTAWAANTTDDICRIYNSNTSTNNASAIYSAYCNYGDGTFTGARFGAVSTGSFSAAFVTALRDSDGAFKERLRITSAGLVGVGTSSPDVDFHVSNADTARIRLENRDVTGSVAQSVGVIEFEGNDGGTGAAGVRANINAVYEGVDGATALAFGTAADGVSVSEKVRIDRNGRVGIGTTGPSQKLDVRVGSTNTAIAQFTGNNDARGLKISTASDAFADDSVILDSQFGGGSLRLAIGGSEKARLDGSGRLLVGTSTARANFYNSTGTPQVQVESINSDGSSLSLTTNFSTATSTASPNLSLARSGATSLGSNTLVAANNALGNINFLGADGSEFVTAAQIQGFVDGTPGANDMPGRLVFSTTADGASSPTERMRINSNGAVGMLAIDGVTGLSVGSASAAGTSTIVAAVRYGATAVYGGTISFQVYSNGNVQNTNNSYGAISDAKLKENIVDAGSQWDDLKALQVRKYNFKEGQTHTQIGLIAQEVELVSPGLVTESPDRDAEGNDLGTVTKSVNYSVLYMKAVKALQEAMERIEQLEQRLTDAGIA